MHVKNNNECMHAAIQTHLLADNGDESTFVLAQNSVINLDYY